MPCDVIGGAVLAIATLSAVVTSERDAEKLAPGHGKWFFGPYGWVLENVRAVHPVACRGSQKLWKLSEEVVAQLGLP